MTVSRWHEGLAANDEAFACQQNLLTPQGLAMTAVKAIREWSHRLLSDTRDYMLNPRLLRM